MKTSWRALDSQTNYTTPAEVASDKYCNNYRLKQRSFSQIGTEIKLLYQIILLAPLDV